MAQKNNRGKTSLPMPEMFDWRMTEAEKKKFSSLTPEQRQALVGQLLEEIRNGFKLSVSYDSYHETFISAVTCKEPNHPNYNQCFTSRHSDVNTVIELAAYKHCALSRDGVWSMSSTSEADWY